jgi:hypothetical protein
MEAESDKLAGAPAVVWPFIHGHPEYGGRSLPKGKANSISSHNEVLLALLGLWAIGVYGRKPRYRVPKMAGTQKNSVKVYLTEG